MSVRGSANSSELQMARSDLQPSIPMVRACEGKSLRSLRPTSRALTTFAPDRDFRRDRSGSVAIEFAFVGLLIILLVLETMQAGYYFYTEAALDRATSKSARQILTGTVANQGMTADNFRTSVLCPLLAPGMSCANVVTNIQTVPENLSPGGFYSFVNSTQTGLVTPAMDNTKTTFCPGQNGSYVYVQVYYAMPTFSPFWLALSSTVWNGNKIHFIYSTAAFKNEPFQLGSQYSGTC